MPKKAVYPKQVRAGSTVVSIYEVRHKTNASGKAYVVSFATSAGRRTIKFADPVRALEEARLKAEQINGGRVDAAHGVTGDDVALLTELRRVVGKTPLLSALEEWAKAKELCGENLLVAARAWSEAHRVTTSFSVTQTVEKFMTEKRRAGVSMKSYEAFLPHFAEEFSDHAITTITKDTIESWIHERFGDEETEVANPGTFNTGRKRLVTLWRWARDNGIVPAAPKTQAELIHPMKEVEQRVGIITPFTFARALQIVQNERPDFLAALVLAGFCGLRRCEIHAQNWEDIDLNRGQVRVTRAKRGTAPYRPVKLCAAGLEWMQAAKRREKDSATGQTPVSPPWGVDRLRALLREREVSVPENGFRHSFISYMVADTNDLITTALKAGNSPAVIRKHYYELVPPEEGRMWFELSPEIAARTAPLGAH